MIDPVSIQAGCRKDVNEIKGRVERWSQNSLSNMSGKEKITENICKFKIAFSQWRAWLIKNYFEMFFYNWPLLSSWKISGLSVQPFTFCQKNAKYFIIFAKKYLSTKIFTVVHQSKKELLDLDQNWAKTRHLLFKTWKSSISMDSPIVQCLPIFIIIPHLDDIHYLSRDIRI